MPKARLRERKNSVIFGLFQKEQKSQLMDVQKRQRIKKPILNDKLEFVEEDLQNMKEVE